MISEELKQAAEKYRRDIHNSQSDVDDEGYMYQGVPRDAFIAGAEWMAMRFSKLYAEKFLSMQVQEPIPESIQKVINDHFWKML